MANVNIEQLTKDGNIIYPVTSFEAVRDEEGRHIGTIIDSRVDDRVDLIFQDTGSSFAGTASYAITASYALNGSGGAAETASYAEHSDWSGINGKPTSTVTDIDDAVTKKHSHSNISLLDSLTEAKTGSWDSAEANAKEYATASVENLKGKIEPILEEFDQRFDNYGYYITLAAETASLALTNAATAQQTADSKWTYNENTIKGVKVNSATAADSATSSSFATNADTLDGKHASEFILASAKGANSGVAELDSAGKVPSSQLPSFVDDVLEYDSISSFPTTGEAGKIYIAKDTNKTYRWSGTQYIEISPSLALGETSATAYRGDRGKIAYDHSQTSHTYANTAGSGTATADSGYALTGVSLSAGHVLSRTNQTNTIASASRAVSAASADSVAWSNVSGKPSTYAPSAHTHSKSEVGLGNVDNTADANKSVKTAATCSGNAATATSLQTTRTIWGQNFNGTDSISGDLTLGDSSTALYLRLNDAYRAGIYYHPAGNEAAVFANNNTATSWIFANTDPANKVDWTTLTPALQIKNQRVVINKLIGNDTDASYNLDVNGTTNASSYTVAGAATMQYDSTNECIKFVFA